jgi:hypothetical protein
MYKKPIFQVIIKREYPTAKKLLVGAQGLSLDAFLRMDSLPIE